VGSLVVLTEVIEERSVLELRFMHPPQ